VDGEDTIMAQEVIMEVGVEVMREGVIMEVLAEAMEEGEVAAAAAASNIECVPHVPILKYMTISFLNM
jgi:hypothetical protein